MTLRYADDPVAGNSTLGYDEISYPGPATTPRAVKIFYCSLTQPLVSDPPCSDETYVGPARQAKRDLFLLGGDSTQNPFNPRVVSSIQLPDGRRYRFGYNAYGEVTTIYLPTGGKLTYEWGPGPGADSTGLVGNQSSSLQIYRRVKSRSVYKNAGDSVPESSTVYDAQTSQACIPQSAWCSTVTVTQRQGAATLANSKHYFYGSPHDPDSYYSDGSYYPPFREGREYKTERFETNSTLLQSESQTWEQRPCESGETCYANDVAPPILGSPVDVRLNSTTSTWSQTGQSSSASFQYDRYNNVKKHTETGFGGVNFRMTDRVFVTTNRLPGETEDRDYTTTAIHLRSLLKQEKVSEWNSTTSTWASVSQADIEYDKNSLDAIGDLAGGLLNTAVVAARGNATKTISSLLGSTTLVNRTMRYDQAGNVVQITDPLGNATAIAYSSTYGHAWPTQVTNAAGHTFQTAYNANTGRPTSFTDPNLKQTFYDHTDTLDRLKFATLPDGGRVDFSYCDPGATGAACTVGKISKTVKQNSCSSTTQNVVTDSFYDGLGRTFKVQQIEDANNSIFTETQYDGLGRVIWASLPYRTGTPTWNGTTYDGLGRPKMIVGPDSSTSSMDYSGPDVTETDPGLKKRKSVSDAFGRLIAVTEDPGGPKEFTTRYRYDALDQLLGVCQGGAFTVVAGAQVCGNNGLGRSFQYDSLKRLTKANNPETGEISYTYDLGGNLTSRTQGNRTVNYTTYDVLNRLTAKSYSGDSAPAVAYVWDTVFKGRLSEVSNSVSKTSFGAYDAMGRVTASSQATPPTAANPKVFAYSYNAAGGLEQEVYPSTRTVKTCYDTQGRPSKVTQKASASSAETDVAKAEPVAGVSAYAPHGGLLSLKLGPSGAVEEKTLYNGRLQPYRLTVGAWQTELFYCAGASDPSASCTSNNGNIHKQVLQALNGVTYTAVFTYDPINRLKSALETKPAGVENWRQTFVYDAYGNRAQLAEAGRLVTMQDATPSVDSETAPQVPWPFNAKNQWTGAAFDLSGNQETTWGPNGTDARAGKFVYDGENRIASAAMTMTGSAGVATAVSYGYDGDGRRVTSTVGGVTTTFVYDAFGAMVAEYGSGLGNSGCLSCLVTVDHLGSTRVVWDANGAPLRLYDYSPFGEELNATLRAGDARYPAPTYPVAARNDVSPLFTGQIRDAETGLDYFGARHMSGPAGRFVSPDWSAIPQPVPYANYQDPQTLNMYSYAGNNPLGRVDSDGHSWWSDWKERFANGMKYGERVTNSELPAALEEERQWLINNVASDDDQVTALRNASTSTINGLFKEWDNSIRDAASGEGVMHGARDFVRDRDGKLQMAAFYRGGDYSVRPGVDVKLDGAGNLKPDGLGRLRGISVHEIPAKVTKFGPVTEILMLPPELEFAQRGLDLQHHEIVNKGPMTYTRYVELIKAIASRPFRGRLK